MFNSNFSNNDNKSTSSNTSDDVKPETKTTNQCSSFNWTAIAPIVFLLIDTICQVLTKSKNQTKY